MKVEIIINDDGMLVTHHSEDGNHVEFWGPQRAEMILNELASPEWQDWKRRVPSVEEAPPAGPALARCETRGSVGRDLLNAQCELTEGHDGPHKVHYGGIWCPLDDR